MNKCKLAVLSGASVYSGVVIAQASSLVNGPSWEVIALGAWGLLMTTIGAVAMTWTAAISSRLKDHEQEFSKLNNHIRDQYHDKSELSELLAPIKQQLQEVVSVVHKIDVIVGKLADRAKMQN